MVYLTVSLLLRNSTSAVCPQLPGIARNLRRKTSATERIETERRRRSRAIPIYFWTLAPFGIEILVLMSWGFFSCSGRTSDLEQVGCLSFLPCHSTNALSTVSFHLTSPLPSQSSPFDLIIIRSFNKSFNIQDFSIVLVRFMLLKTCSLGTDDSKITQII